ncbi:MAG: hypothetical protein AAF531_15335 [Actinomycetota bacterium]
MTWYTVTVGFSLHFVRFDDETDIDGFRRFLDERQLVLVPSEFGSELCNVHTADGEPLQLDGESRPTLLNVADPNTSDHVSAHIERPSLTLEALRFVYDLCVAARLAIVNPQGDPDDSSYPMMLIPARNHTAQQLQQIAEDTGLNHRFVDNAQELRAILVPDPAH